MLFYACTDGMVVTNSTFTDAACDLAKRDSRITLRDGRWLAEQIKLLLPPEIPEFSWEEYNRVVENHQPFPARSRRNLEEELRQFAEVQEAAAKSGVYLD